MTHLRHQCLELVKSYNLKYLEILRADVTRSLTSFRRFFDQACAKDKGLITCLYQILFEPYPANNNIQDEKAHISTEIKRVQIEYNDLRQQLQEAESILNSSRNQYKKLIDFNLKKKLQAAYLQAQEQKSAIVNQIQALENEFASLKKQQDDLAKQPQSQHPSHHALDNPNTVLAAINRMHNIRDLRNYSDSLDKSINMLIQFLNFRHQENQISQELSPCCIELKKIAKETERIYLNIKLQEITDLKLALIESMKIFDSEISIDSSNGPKFYNAMKSSNLFPEVAHDKSSKKSKTNPSSSQIGKKALEQPNLITNLIVQCEKMENLSSPCRSILACIENFNAIISTLPSSYRLPDDMNIFEIIFSSLYATFSSIAVEMEAKARERECEEILLEVNNRLLPSNQFESVKNAVVRLKQIMPNKVTHIVIQPKINDLIQSIKDSIKQDSYEPARSKYNVLVSSAEETPRRRVKLLIEFEERRTRSFNLDSFKFTANYRL